MRENKSTNVRILTVRLLARASARWPRVAARWLEPLFRRTPRRRPVSEAAREVLAAGERFTVFLDGKPIVAWRWGLAGAPTVLLVHGWGGRAAQMTGFVEPLVAAGLSPVAFDAPGHGESPGAHSSLPELARAIAAVAAAAGPPAAVVGHSLGGAATALAVARGALQTDRVALLAPPADARAWFSGFADRLALAPEVAAATRARVEERVGLRLDTLHVAALAPSLRVPALVIHDTGDAKVPWADGAAYAAAAPSAALVTTEGLGHDGILRDDATVRRAVEFVAGARVPDETAELERELYERERRWAA
jgi:pimeloyl-ACP methyl ester carboxylesterase